MATTTTTTQDLGELIANIAADLLHRYGTAEAATAALEAITKEAK